MTRYHNHSCRISFTVAAVAMLLIAQSRPSSATALNIDFGGFFGAPASNYGAYANQPGVWNKITTTGSSNLVDLSGANLPGTNLNLSMTTTISFETTDGFFGPNPGLSVNDQALVGDNFATGGGTWNVTISGLQNGQYDLYVYSSINSLVPTSTYSVNGTSEANLLGGSHDSSPLVEGTNFAIDSILISSGTLSINSGSGATYSGLAGLQLVEVATTPIPATLPLFASGLGALGFFSWRKRQKRSAAV